MYKPAPPRLKKTNIVRTRTGCKGCRKRRTKCDEQKPSCSTCTRLGRPCEQFSPKLEFRNVLGTGIRGQQGKHGKLVKTTNAPSFSISVDDGPVASSTDQASLGGGGSVWAPPLGSQAIAAEAGSAEITGWALQEDSILLAAGWHFLGGDPSFGHDKAPSIQDSIEASLPPLDVSAPFDGRNHEHIDEAHPRMPRTLLPHRDPIYPVIFYTDVWRKQCLPALHASFHHVETLLGPPLLMTDIIVALSACRLSRTLPQGKLFHASSTPGLCFRPDAGHESLSHEHYGAVMRKVAWWNPQDFDANPTLGLAILVLFCYLESSMGNFREYRVHSDGAKKLMRSNPGWMVRHGAGLLAAWVEVETQNYWRRMHFSTSDFHWSHGTQPPLGPQAEPVLDPASHPRATVLTILCETHRLNTAAIASCWGRSQGKDLQGSATSASLPTAAGKSDLDRRLLLNLTLSEYAALLKVQSKKLDDWTSLLPEFCQDNGPHAAAPGRRGLDIHPLRFRSQASAINFAYYVTARVMQCIGPLESLERAFQVDVDEKYREAEAWIMTLLRIAAGLDWDECVRLNVYTIGFVSLLPDCILRSRSPAVGLWMEDWLEERLKGDTFEEGNFPVFQVLEILRLVNRERGDGRDVVSLFQTVDDGGGSGKLGSYYSQSLSSVWVYGRCRTTGTTSSYIMAL